MSTATNGVSAAEKEAIVGVHSMRLWPKPVLASSSVGVRLSKALRSDQQLPQLDGLRGIAIVVVLWWHLFPPKQEGIVQTILGPLRHLGNLGWTGVDLFFVLSGFLIGGILLDRKDAPNFFATFYRRRFARILPLYGLLVVVGGLLFLATQGSFFSLVLFEQEAIAWWPYLLFLQNFFMMTSFGSQWLGVTWSLAIEEQFYVVFPLLIRALPRRAIVPLVVGMIGVAPLLRVLVISTTVVGRAHVLPFCRMDAIAIGVLVAVAWRSQSFDRVVRIARLALAPLFAAFVFVVAVDASRELLGAVSHRALRYSVILAFYAAVLILVVDGGPRIVRTLANAPLRFIGRISYGLYLFRVPVLYGMHALLLKAHPSANTLGSLTVSLVAVALSVVVAWLSFRYFESPILRAARRTPFAPPVDLTTRA